MTPSINSPPITLLIALMGDQQNKFKAALEAMRLNKERFFKAESASIDLIDHHIKSIFNDAVKDLFFYLVEDKWYKICQGHEVKVDRQLSKKEANQKAKRAAEEIKEYESIIKSSVLPQVRGKHDPYVHFKYINNCSACSCVAHKVKNIVRVQVADVVTLGETLAQSEQISSGEYYQCLMTYILQNNRGINHD